MAKEDGTEDKVDRGDNLTEEQAAAAEPTGGAELTEEEEKKAALMKLAEEAEASKKGEAKEEEAKKAGEEGEEEKPKTGWVPSFRMRAATARAKAAEEENAALKARLAEQTATPPLKAEPESGGARDFDAEIDALDEKLVAAMTDNDPVAIAALNRDIRAVERDRTATLVAEARNEGTSAQEAVAARAFEETLAIIESEVPQLDPDNKELFDERKTEMVQRVMRSYEADGLPSDEALVYAVAAVFPEEEAAPTAGKAPDRGIAAKVEALKGLAPDVNVAGQDADAAGLKAVPNIGQLSEEDLAALPASTLKLMRGDMVA